MRSFREYAWPLATDLVERTIERTARPAPDVAAAGRR
jgi:hypothetical protein